jgi:hypothetical protein
MIAIAITITKPSAQNTTLNDLYILSCGILRPKVLNKHFIPIDQTQPVVTIFFQGFVK